MAPPQKHTPKRHAPQREPEPPPAPAPKPSSHPTELGWLPDCVYTGEKFESGLAFFADSLGRITRFSREPADLAIARRLQGQAALPGLINGHSVSWQRLLRGRTERAGRNGADSWRETRDSVLAKLTSEDVFQTARMAFTEMMLSGVTCVGEFHEIRNQPDGSANPESHAFADAILRAAHEAGIRIAFFNSATLRSDAGQPGGSGFARSRRASADAFIKECESLRVDVVGRYAADEAWLGVAPHSLATVPLDAFKAIATYARAQRMRLQTHVAATAEETAAIVAEQGRSPIAVLGDHGLVDKRFTALGGAHLTDDDCKLLGAARASLCACPSSERDLAVGSAPLEKLLAAGAGVAFGTGSQAQIDLLREARTVELEARVAKARRPAFGPDPAKVLFHAATVTGARNLGATGGALEVGRPADFFTVNLYDASIAGSDPTTLLDAILFGLERRAVREVWIGARQRIVNGRHPNQGLIVGRYVEMQQRLWHA